MKRIFFAFSFVFINVFGFAQNAALAKSFQKFEKDPQLKAAVSSLYVVNAKTGKVIFDKNSSIGLAPASTQKIITTASAYELLGKDFRYKTQFAIDKVDSSLAILPGGDPTFGSWRWDATNEFTIMKQVVQAVKKLKVKQFAGVVLDGTGWESESIPDGWTWQDIGNYYGAGAEKLNLRENKFLPDRQFSSRTSVIRQIDSPANLVFLHRHHNSCRCLAKSSHPGLTHFPIRFHLGQLRQSVLL